MTGCLVIAGLGPGFCEELAWKFAREGYSVGMFSRSPDYLNAFEGQLTDAGHDALALPTDITDPEEVARGFDEIRDTLGPVEVLANTASTTTGGSSELDPDRLEMMWRLYAYSGLLCFREAFDDLSENNGTALFFGALSDVGDYAFQSAKDAMYGLARSLATQYGHDGPHIVHVRILGRLLNPDAYEKWGDIDEEEYIDIEAAAESCYHLTTQPDRARTFEFDLHSHAKSIID